jgi:hypothetical protein
MLLFQYFRWVGSFLLVALFAASWWFSGNVADAPPSKAPLSESIHIRIHSDHKWPERVVFDTTRARLAPAENAQAEPEPQGQDASQTLVTARRHDPVEAFAEMAPETVEGRLPPPYSSDQNPESDAPPKRKSALLQSHPGASRAAKAFTAPNPFHRLPGKS